MVDVRLNDGTSKQLPDGVTVVVALKELMGPKLKKAVAARVNGRETDLNARLAADAAIEPIEAGTPEGIGIMRHSASHVMADAVKRLFPQAKLAIGPSIEDGFYYDFEVERPFTPDDLAKIESEMQKISGERKQFKRSDVPKQEALKLMQESGQTYKIERINDLGDEAISLYRHGDFVDLCRGPHVQDTGKIGAFKLTSVAGAYWRGDVKNKMLQRIYGTAFPGQKELDDHLMRIEEAKKRDHRKLGKELDLFSIQEEAGAGLIYWHPKGALIRNIIEEFWRSQHLKHGYQLIYSPHIARVGLWKTSGHWDFYRENMYSPIDIEGQEFLLKPMNCPGHLLIYKTSVRSYRDLPMRWAELGTVYRFESSGTLHGLMRVRGFTQDDAHVFCRPDQLEDEVAGVIRFGIMLLNTFGFTDFEIVLSTRPQKHVGTVENWDKATVALKKALDACKVPYRVAEGEAVFYGPKADIHIKDSLGRSWQCFTVQVDFNLPERFDVTYVGEDGQHHRPIMIHRALLGSMERFFGVLIEHYAGAFPLWLNPVQMALIPVAQDHHAYAREVAEEFVAAGIRVSVEAGKETVGHKIRTATVQKVPYMAVIGDREVQGKNIAVRHRTKGDLGVFETKKFVRKLQRQVEGRK
jgi:threonyl-tRNA synthetase